MVPYHTQSVEQVFETFGVNPEYGLGRREIKKRGEKHGPNELRESESRSIRQILFEQFKSMVIIVLLIADAVAFVFRHWAEAVAIAAVLMINAAIGFFTEWKAVQPEIRPKYLDNHRRKNTHWCSL